MVPLLTKIDHSAHPFIPFLTNGNHQTIGRPAEIVTGNVSQPALLTIIGPLWEYRPRGA